MMPKLRLKPLLSGAQGRLQIFDCAIFFVNEKHSSLFCQRGYTALASAMAIFFLNLKQLSESNLCVYFAYAKVFNHTTWSTR
jgi:hypothetical protein